MLQHTYYSQNYAGIIWQGLFRIRTYVIIIRRNTHLILCTMYYTTTKFYTVVYYL